jgi:hypothetical protein
MPTSLTVGIAHPTLLLQLKDANHGDLIFFYHGDRLLFFGYTTKIDGSTIPG